MPINNLRQLRYGSIGLAFVLFFPLAAIAQNQTEQLFKESHPEVVTFSLPLAQIQKAELSDAGELHVLLNAEGRDRLSDITRSHQSKPMEIVIAGHVVSRFTVVTEIESGVLRIPDPEVALLKAVDPHL
ncbi:hypothetical protein SAMN05216429_10994 [Marinobacter persicus]|uniref:Uncharacterized protein n=1 Tax=Marinobacter persicus TaxID=930118 RepID=A0A1I3WCI5_9GAMM|nr:hypothetical protein [Marinobacter persicus]GHD47177.1 hypothetical protein GCM10008110_14750 [Marinobacter persicus]SFK04191.1 hypothetical protein SAMN05216429_10994 [Marinobacter persicus]